MELLLWAIAVILILIGIAGMIVPVLPGIGLVFLGLLFAAWIDDFQRVGAVTLTILALLTLAAVAVDFLAAAVGVKRAGASKGAITGATVGTLLGLFFGLAGLFLGPFIGAVTGELLARNDLKQAGKAGFGVWLGLLLGIALKFGLVFTMVGVFIAAYLL